jgi:Tol biopolymer transport system component
MPALIVVTVLGGVTALDSTSMVTVRQADNRPSSMARSAPSVSRDGRYVAFTSYARLVDADTNDLLDVYVLDRVSGRVTVETEPSLDTHAGRDNDRPRLSGDGRFLVYESNRQRTGPDDVLPDWVIGLRDRQTASVRIVSREGRVPDGASRGAEVSADGRLVVFSSSATNLVDGPDANGISEDVYAYDIGSGTITRVSVDSSGRQPEAGSSFAPSVSDNGRYIAFTSTAVFDTMRPARPSSNRPLAEVYVRDTVLGTTTRTSAGPDGGWPNGPSYAPAISGRGRYVAFVSDAANLVSRDRNGYPDVFVRDLEQRTTMLVSRSVSGGSANGPSVNPAIASDGEIVAFQSDASDLVCAARCPDGRRDINLVSDVFLFNRATTSVECISRGRQTWMEPSLYPAIDGSGSVVAFSSRHPIEADDTSNDLDLFVWTRPSAASTRLTLPDVAGVRPFFAAIRHR